MGSAVFSAAGGAQTTFLVQWDSAWGETVSKLHRGAVAQLGCTVYSFGYGVFLFGYDLGTHFFY